MESIIYDLSAARRESGEPYFSRRVKELFVVSLEKIVRYCGNTI